MKWSRPVQTNDFRDRLLIGIARAIDLGVCLLIGVVGTIELEGSLLIRIVGAIESGASLLIRIVGTTDSAKFHPLELSRPFTTETAYQNVILWTIRPGRGHLNDVGTANNA